MEEFITCIDKYADFNGRARRREYWMFYLWNLIFSFAISIVIAILNGIFRTWIFNIFSAIYIIALIIPSLAVLVRRLHDTNKSAWWLLISLVPIVGEIVLFVFVLLDSDSGTNNYGPNPKLEN